MKIKARETSVDHWGHIEWIERFDFGNLLVEDRRTTKNDEEQWRIFTETIFLTNFKRILNTRRAEPNYSTLFPLFIGEKREVVDAQLA